MSTNSPQVKTIKSSIKGQKIQPTYFMYVKYGHLCLYASL